MCHIQWNSINRNWLTSTVPERPPPLPEAGIFKYYKLYLIIFFACSKNTFLFNMILFLNGPVSLWAVSDAPRLPMFKPCFKQRLRRSRQCRQIPNRTFEGSNLFCFFLVIYFSHIAINVLEHYRTFYRILVREIPP